MTDANGTFVERLTNTGYSAGASWSPDGRYLAYSTGETTGAHLAILDTITGETTHLTSDNDAEPYGRRTGVAWCTRVGSRGCRSYGFTSLTPAPPGS